MLVSNEKITAIILESLPEKNKKIFSAKDIFSVFRDLLFIIAILLFFTGWLFLYFYMKFLGVPMHETSQQIYSFYFYSLNVIIYIMELISLWLELFICLVVLLIVSTSLVIFFKWAVLRPYFTRFLPFLLLVLVIFWLAGGFVLARKAALEATATIRNGAADYTVFEFRKKGNLADANISYSDNHTRCLNKSTHIRRICSGNLERTLYLITKTSSHYVVYYSPLGSFKEEPTGFVYYIPISEVTTAETHVQGH